MSPSTRTKRIQQAVVLWALLAVLLAWPFRTATLAITNSVAANQSSTTTTSNSEEEDHDNQPSKAFVDADIEFAALHPRLEIHLAHRHPAPATAAIHTFETPLALRWRAADDRSPRGPPPGDIPARAPPVS